LTGFGWTRLAYLLVVLSVLGALAQLGSPSADPRPLAAGPPEIGETDGDPPDAVERPRVPESASSRASAPRENSGPPAFARHLKRAAAGGLAAAPDAGKAIFHRPPPGPPADAEGASGPGPVCGDLGRTPSGQRLVFPLPMQNANSYDDTWGAPRPQGGHEGTDLMVPTGTPEYAVTDGTVVPVAGSNGNGWNSLGGYAVMLRAAYSVGPVREGDLFYYAHLEEKSALPIGSTVRAGQVVGYAGDTGQGPEVTRGLFPPHLHFGWYDAGGGRSYLPSGAMNPFPLLEWVSSGGGVLGGGSDARYCEVPRSGAPIPSTGADRWPAPGNDGARPDLDTGKRDPAPSPVVAGNRPKAQERPDARPEPQDRPPARDPREGSGKTPDRDPRAPKPPPPDRAPGEDPGQPAPGDEPASPGPLAEQDPEGDPRDPPPSPENEPPPGGGNPGGGQDNEEPREDEDEPGQEPPGDQSPDQDEPGKGEDPEEENPREEPEEDPAPSEGEDAPDENENPESTVPEAGGSEDAEPEETTLE
jgi:murein DD-endopeptidase MepM/ murein hydrolase activator NlpD